MTRRQEPEQRSVSGVGVRLVQPQVVFHLHIDNLDCQRIYTGFIFGDFEAVGIDGRVT